jgi:hypothetical protein
MTDFYIAKDGTAGGTGTISDPVLTVDQALALSNFTHPATEHTLIFRAGTYDTEIDTDNTTSYQLKLTGLSQACNLKGYEGETVIFKPVNNVQYLCALVSIANNTGTEITVTIENIEFENNGSNEVQNAFIRMDSASNAVTKVNTNVKNCTFTQDDGDVDLLVGCTYFGSSANQGSDVTISDCTFNFNSRRCIHINTLKGLAIIKNNTINVTSPTLMAANDADKLLFVAKPNNYAVDSTVKLEDNKFIYNLSSFNTDGDLIQLDYVNNIFLSNNYFEINPAAGVVLQDVGPLKNILKVFNSATSTHASHVNRDLKTLNISSNVIIRNDTRGVFAELTGSGSLDAASSFSGSVLTVDSNVVVATNTLLRTTDVEGRFIRITKSPIETIEIKNNFISGLPDGIILNRGGEGSVTIENNVFDNMGEDGAGSYTDARVLDFLNVGTSSNPVQIRKNIFNIGQLQTCLFLSGSGSTTHVNVEENTFICPKLRSTSSAVFPMHYSSTGTEDQHTFKNNYYLNMENLNATSIAVVGSAGKTLAALKVLEPSLHTNNLVKRTKGGLIKRPIKLLGT